MIFQATHLDIVNFKDLYSDNNRQRVGVFVTHKDCSESILPVD